MARKLSREEFLEKAKLVHGDKYNYDDFEYVNASIKSKIYCNTCQDHFNQTPSKHMFGQGCPVCAKIDRAKRRALTTDIFIERSIAAHGAKYDYSCVEYKNNHEKVKIKCNKCGEYFFQMPHLHMSGCGCRSCSERALSDRFKLSYDDFMSRIECFKDRFDYSLINKDTDLRSKAKIRLICKKHKNEFEVTVDCHVNRGHGCPICKAKAIGDSKRLGNKEFKKRSILAHGDRFDLSQVEYVNQDTYIRIKCKKHDKWFDAHPYSHLASESGGCHECYRERGTGMYTLNTLPEDKYNNPCSLYFVKMEYCGDTFYKIGVTKRYWKKRFSRAKSLGLSVSKVVEIKSSMLRCLVAESEIKESLEELGLRYKVHHLRDIDYGGWTETFERNGNNFKIVKQLIREHFPINNP